VKSRHELSRAVHVPLKRGFPVVIEGPIFAKHARRVKILQSEIKSGSVVGPGALDVDGADMQQVMLDPMQKSDAPAEPAAHADGGVKVSVLPFVVRLVRTEAQLQKVCELRAASYGHHLPEFGETLLQPDAHDTEPGTVIFVAEDKATGAAVGTIRIHLNTHQPLPLESAIDLPPHIQGHLLVEVSRLSVRPGYNQMSVRLALFKALYLYCYANQVQFMVVTARRPLDRVYKSLGFTPVHGEDRWVPIPYTGNIEHTVLVFDVLMADRTWYNEHHRLFPFMRTTYHPDIQVFSAVSSGWTTPRRNRGA